MSNKNGNVIKTIQQGRLDIYVPLKFETKYDYLKLCNKFGKCIDTDIKKHSAEIQKSLQNTYDDIIDEMHITNNGKLTLKNTLKRWFRHRSTHDKTETLRAGDGTKIEVFSTDNGIGIELKPGEINAYTERCEELKCECAQHKKLYGSEYVSLHKRFVLLPLRVQLNNNEVVWLNVILYVFGNKMGALKLELPLINVSAQPFMDYNFDNLIKKVDDEFGVISIDQDVTIKAVYDKYIKKLVDKIRVNIIAQESVFRNIILTRFDGIPKHINSIPNDVQEDLFRIIAAPVPVRESTSYSQMAREFIAKQSWGENNVKYITSPNGGCLSIVDLSIVDLSIVDWLKEHYKKILKIEELEPDSIKTIHKNLIRDLCINVEFTILLLLLKRMNVTYSYGMKIANPKDVHKVQSAYNLNLMFISDLQMNCYGTVSEQVIAFENMMPHYLKEKISSLKMKAIDSILSDEENHRYSLLQNFLSFGGLVIALVFGLPAISDTITIIRNACTFITGNIPVLTIQNLSIMIWIVLIVFLCIHTIKCNSNSAKRRLKF